jgi:hypothetical protein
MKRVFAVALVVGATMVGAASAQERISSDGVRQAESVRVVQTREAAPLIRRCSGTGCLQNIPSLGVAF